MACHAMFKKWPSGLSHEKNVSPQTQFFVYLGPSRHVLT